MYVNINIVINLIQCIVLNVLHSDISEMLNIYNIDLLNEVW